MATFNKINSYIADIHNGIHDLSADQLAIATTDTAPTAASTNYASLASPLASTNLSGANPYYITTTSSTQTAGAYSLVLADLVLTATGAYGPFRYIAVYNTAAPASELLGWIDIGSEVSLSTGQTFTVDLDQATGAITAS
jgi:hypothetical protein